MSEPLRDGIHYGSIISTGWYPIVWYKDLFHAIRRTSGEGKDLIHQIGRQCTRDDMSGIYKVLAALISPRAGRALELRAPARRSSTRG
ncbi:hypothetical protein [Sorangium sp. So ce590]|uniref:hypothetical protein n=1 Tax=unclassified Sorangium TaxID=2621164 RepID=UPI003F5D6D92